MTGKPDDIERVLSGLVGADGKGVARLPRRRPTQLVDTGRGTLTAYLNGRVLKRWPYKLLNK